MKRIAAVALPLAVLGLGALVTELLIRTGPQAAPTEVETPAVRVHAELVSPVSFVPTIRGMGRVAAERSVALAPEVAGRVKERNHALVPGGLVAKGEPLMRVDARDYTDTLKMTQAELASARLRVREETTLRQVAEHEWRDVPEGFSDETIAYALREPHIDAARAQVESARTRIAQAKRNLGRTILRAPFDAVVLEQTVDLGQSVSPAAPVVTLAGTARFRVELSLPIVRLDQLAIPGVNASDGHGSPATIYTQSQAERDGAVIRLERSVDSRGRMAQLHVGIDDPMSLEQPVESRPLPLLLGTSVRVELKGNPIDNAYVLPRSAIQQAGDQVWILDAESKIRARPVTVAWRERSVAVVTEGLAPQERVVTTPMPLATDGMKVEFE